MLEVDKLETIEDGYCEEHGKQSDKTFWFSYYDPKKKCFIFDDAHCFICDEELFLEIEEKNLSKHFNEEEIKILLKAKGEE